MRAHFAPYRRDLSAHLGRWFDHGQAVSQRPCHDDHVIEVERVAGGDAERAASILNEAAAWLIDSGRGQWPLEGLSEHVAEAVAAGEAYLATRDGVDVASWFLTTQDTFWWPELGPDHGSRFFHKFAVCVSV